VSGGDGVRQLRGGRKRRQAELGGNWLGRREEQVLKEGRGWLFLLVPGKFSEVLGGGGEGGKKERLWDEGGRCSTIVVKKSTP